MVINRNKSCIWMNGAIFSTFFNLRLIETRVVFELIYFFVWNRINIWLIETRVVFELAGESAMADNCCD